MVLPTWALGGLSFARLNVQEEPLLHTLGGLAQGLWNWQTLVPPEVLLLDVLLDEEPASELADEDYLLAAGDPRRRSPRRPPFELSLPPSTALLGHLFA